MAANIALAGLAWDRKGPCMPCMRVAWHIPPAPFLAGSQLAIFDPHCEHLPNISAVNPGKRIDFVATSAQRDHPDQFEPYQAFGCDARSTFQGTLFRFPLRSPELAARSRISKQARMHVVCIAGSSYILSSAK